MHEQDDYPVLQGRLNAVQAANVTLLQQRAARRQPDGRPALAKAATARSTAARPSVTRPSRTPGPSRKTATAPAPTGKTAIRRKRG